MSCLLTMHWSRGWSYTVHVSDHALITWLIIHCSRNWSCTDTHITLYRTPQTSHTHSPHRKHTHPTEHTPRTPHTHHTLQNTTHTSHRTHSTYTHPTEHTYTTHTTTPHIQNTHTPHRTHSPQNAYAECCEDDPRHLLFDRLLQDVGQDRDDVVAPQVFTHLWAKSQEPHRKDHLILELKATLVTQNAHDAERNTGGNDV